MLISYQNNRIQNEKKKNVSLSPNMIQDKCDREDSN